MKGFRAREIAMFRFLGIAFGIAAMLYYSLKRYWRKFVRDAREAKDEEPETHDSKLSD